jgi:hypothetical protein
LRTESSVYALQEEVNAYLSAINALKLINPEDAWILNSKPPSKKIRFRFEEETTQNVLKKPEKKITILDLEKNYLLCLSILKLHFIQHSNMEQIGPRLDAKEYFNLLVRNQLYNLAFSFAKVFEFDFSPVFEEITRKCLLNLPVDDSLDDWSDPTHSISQNLSGWKLLERYLKVHDGKHSNFLYHHNVANQILSFDPNALPSWISSFLLSSHPLLLVRLYIQYDLIDLATETLLSLFNSSNSFCQIPWNLVDKLLLILKERKKDDLHQNLLNLSKSYLDLN